MYTRLQGWLLTHCIAVEDEHSVVNVLLLKANQKAMVAVKIVSELKQDIYS